MHLSIPPRARGFTLIELMVAVVIAGILAAIAYPSYTSFVQRSRRADAMAVLTAIVQAQERYRSNSTAYASTTKDLNVTVDNITKYYSVNMSGVGDPPAFTTGYVATASVISGSAQNNDTNCTNISVNMVGSILTYTSTSSDGSDTRNICWSK